MVDPAGATGALTKLGDALKGWPLWLLVGVATCLTVFLAVPQFRALASPPPFDTVLLFATVAAWILATAKALSFAPAMMASRRAERSARTKFVITPVDGQCTWGISKQPDGSFVTQFSSHFMVKNRTAGRLHLMKASVIKPKVYGEDLPGLVIVRALDNHMYGTAHVTGNFIPPHGALPAAVTLLFAGMPRQRSGHMNAVIEITDADANNSRASVKMRCMMPGPEYKDWFTRLLRRFWKARR